MEASQLTTLLESLQSAFQNSKVDDLRKTLAEVHDADIPLPLMKQVPIGKFVNKLAQEAQADDIKSLAGKCVAKWKAQLVQNNEAALQRVSSQGAPSTSLTRSNSAESDEPSVKRVKLDTSSVSSSTSTVTTPKPLARSASTPAAATPATEEEKRVQKLVESFQMYFPDHDQPTLQKLSQNIWTGE